MNVVVPITPVYVGEAVEKGLMLHCPGDNALVWIMFCGMKDDIGPVSGGMVSRMVSSVPTCR